MTQTVYHGVVTTSTLKHRPVVSMAEDWQECFCFVLPFQHRTLRRLVVGRKLEKTEETCVLKKQTFDLEVGVEKQSHAQVALVTGDSRVLAPSRGKEQARDASLDPL